MFIDFVKMHANGNDFVVAYTDRNTVDALKPRMIQQWSHRHTGIGFDQLLFVQVDSQKNIYCQIFNADGSEVGQCGNGLACVGQFLYQQRYIQANTFDITTSTGTWNILILENDWVHIALGKPIFEPKCVPFKSNAQSLLYPILLEGIDPQSVTALQKICIDQYNLLRSTLETSLFSTLFNTNTLNGKYISLHLYGGILNLGGNPHCVIPVTNLQDIPTFLGPLISKHTLFPKETNVEFIQWRQPNEIALRAYERGVGETKACGSGACAAMMISRLLKIVDSQSKVHFSSNNSTVYVEWPKPFASVCLKTQTHTIFHGKIRG